MKLSFCKNILSNKKKTITVVAILFIGLLLRLYLSRFGNGSGDVLVFAEWGERFWKLPLREYYQDRNWYFSFPTYPPLSNLMYGGLYWLNEHQYILAEIHNKTRLIPSQVLIFLGSVRSDNPFRWNEGYFLLLKLPVILADVGIGYLVYKIVLELKKAKITALLALVIYIFNPVTVFISSVWGQSESLIAFFGLLSFYLLYKKNFTFSIPALLVSLYLKPNWIIFVPLYFYVLYLIKPKIHEILGGVLLSFVIVYISTRPFAGNNLFGFMKNTVIANMLPASKGTQKLSISAFNLYSVFTKIDTVSASEKVLLPLSYWGWVFFGVIYAYVFKTLKKQKVNLENVFWSIFSLGMGSFLFLTGMLERYVFPAFPAMVILVFTDFKKILWGALINIVILLNLIWAFYRRSSHDMRSVFEGGYDLLIRLLSLINIVGFVNLFMIGINKKK